MSKCHAALGLLAKMPALERLMLPSGCLDLRSTAALRQHEALSGRAFLPGSLDRPWHFVPFPTSLHSFECQTATDFKWFSPFSYHSSDDFETKCWGWHRQSRDPPSLFQIAAQSSERQEMRRRRALQDTALILFGGKWIYVAFNIIWLFYSSQLA